MPRTRRSAFTLVELLVVIGIIALLISILLPSLNAARAQARAIKSAANLRSIGQAMQIYLNSYKQTYPAAYVYEGMSLTQPNPYGDPATNGQSPTSATHGYRHISSFLYGHETILKNAGETGGIGEKGSIPGAEAFRNPQLDSGGLPPTNPAADNIDPGQKKETLTVVDFQAPRIGYVFNEAICPRNKFTLGFQSTTNVYHYIRSGVIKNSSNVILATEFTTDWKIVSGADRTAGTDQVCKSHRPIHAFTQNRDGTGDANLNMELSDPTKPYYRVRYQDLMTNAPRDYVAANSKSRLDWVGRFGTASNWEKKNTSFLYVDGHAETKNIRDTLDDNWQWGDRMYTQTANGPDLSK